ncbi:MAG: hypothetical protein Q9216_003130 [Gyalolechia sp. 2 TL-2023]
MSINQGEYAAASGLDIQIQLRLQGRKFGMCLTVHSAMEKNQGYVLEVTGPSADRRINWSARAELLTRPSTSMTVSVSKENISSPIPSTKFSPYVYKTCTQIYAEAAAIFWSENYFKFSGQGGWQGLLRFFLTIGPNARRHIGSLDVCVPHQRFDSPPERYRDAERLTLEGRSKNDPKLRMTKVPPQIGDEDAYIGRVCEIMLKDRAVRHLNLLIPTGRSLIGYMTFDRPEHETIMYLRRSLKLLSATEINLVVEPGALLSVPFVFPQLDMLGWNLVCHPGAYVRDPEDEDRGWQFQELYVREHDKYDFLEGIPTMFGDEEECDVLEEVWERAQPEKMRDILLWKMNRSPSLS